MKTILSILIIASISKYTFTQEKSTLMDRGTELFFQGDFKGSQFFYDSLINIYPDSSILFSSRAGVFYWMQNYEQSILDCNQSIKLDSINHAAYYNRGLTFLNLGDERKAKMDFEKTILLQPDFSDAYNYLATCYSLLGLNTIALENINKAIKLNQNNGLYYYSRAVINSQMKKNIELIIKDYDKAIELDSSLASAYMNRGIIKVNELKDYYGANQDFTSYLKIHPNDLNALSNRGVTFFNLKNLKSAKLDFEAVLLIEPNNELALRKLELIKNEK